MEQREKRSRCINFSTQEVETLVALVETHKSVVECKKTDTSTNNQKEMEWKKIANTFNSIAATGRTSTMLRSKWESLKKNSKKEFANYNRSLYKTEGGPPPRELSRLVISILKILNIETKFNDYTVLCEIEENMNSNNETSSNSIASSLPDTSVPGCSYDNPIIALEDNLQVKVEVNDEVSPTPTWNNWSPENFDMPVNKLIQTSPIQENVATKNPIKGNPLKRKLSFSPRKSVKGMNKDIATLVYEKKQFLEFQMQLLEREAEDKRIKLQEEHDIKMKIYNLELLIKQKQLALLD